MLNELDMMVDETMGMNHFLHGKNPFLLDPDLFSLFDEKHHSMGVLFRLIRKNAGIYQLHLIPTEDLKSDLLQLLVALMKKGEPESEFDESQLHNLHQLMPLMKKFGLLLYPLNSFHDAQVLTYHLHGKWLVHEDEMIQNGEQQDLRQGLWLHGGEDYLILRVGEHPGEAVKGWSYLGPIADRDWIFYHFSKMEEVLKRFYPIDHFELSEQQIIIKNHVPQKEFLELVLFLLEGRPLRFEALAVAITEDEELREFFYETFLVRKFWLQLQTHLYLS